MTSNYLSHLHFCPTTKSESVFIVSPQAPDVTAGLSAPHAFLLFGNPEYFVFLPFSNLLHTERVESLIYHSHCLYYARPQVDLFSIFNFCTDGFPKFLGTFFFSGCVVGYCRNVIFLKSVKIPLLLVAIRISRS